MKTIGIIGGVGWSSTVYYYEIINKAANEYFGDLTAPNILVNSLNFEPLKGLQLSEQWSATVPILVDAAKSLERAGSDILMIASATTNIPYVDIVRNVSVPVIDIVRPTAKAIKRMKYSKVGLIGTKPTMEHDFFQSKLADFGIDSIVPVLSDRKIIHRIIYEELCKDVILDRSREVYKEIIGGLERQGAEAVILGCTEIPLLIDPKDVDLELFDMAKLHAMEAFEIALA